MKTLKYLKNSAIATALLLSVAYTTSCTSDTGIIGVPPSNETIKTSVEIFDVYSSTFKLDSVEARSSSSYLGAIYDPETNGKLKANFLTQFSILEDIDYFPHRDSITSRDANNNPCCDSVFLQFHFNKYFGDVNTPLKLAIYPLDFTKPLHEDSTYYTTTNLRQYIRPGYENTPIATKVFTAYDRIHGSDPSNPSGNYPSIKVPLPTEEGNFIMSKYFEYTEDNKGLDYESHVNRNFDDSYHFIRNVLPGYYAEIINGEGVIVNVFVDALYLLYNAKIMNDSVVENLPSYSVFAGTQEVIQSCEFTQSDVSSILEDNTCTWLKTPVGIGTELTIPVDDIFSQTHKNDSLSRIDLMLTRYNKEQTGEQFGIPQNLLLIKKSEIKDFFTSKKVPDGITSYVTNFMATYNTYDFSNIAQMAMYMHKERMQAVMSYINEELKITSPTEEQIAEYTHEWTKQNPDWNKCCLIPVDVTKNNSTGAVTSIMHNLSLTSAKLVKGTKDNPIKIQVYYTRVSAGPAGK